MPERGRRVRGQAQSISAGMRRMLEPYSAASLLRLLDAASVSPAAVHRVISIGKVYCDVIRLLPSGQSEPSAGFLSELLAEARRSDPTLERLEDYVPLNPRTSAKVRWKADLLSFAPGSLERPVATVERARRVASTIDMTLLSILGFRLSDMVELILRRVDQGAEATASLPFIETVKDLGEPARLTMSELVAVSQLPPIETIPRQCLDPAAAGRALEWATVPANKIRYEPSMAQAGFGKALRYATESASFAIPLGFWPDALDHFVNVLAGIASESDPRLEQRFLDESKQFTRQLLKRLRASVSFDIPVGRTDVAFAAAAFGTNSVVGFEVIGGLRRFVADSTRAKSNLNALDSEEPVVTAGTLVGKREGVAVTKVLVTASSGHVISPSVTGFATCSLDDLIWIVNQSVREPDDVLQFFKEFAEHPLIGEIVGHETINAFEYWRRNHKAFIRQGSPVDVVWIAPHQSDAEWDEAIAHLPLEVALHKLEMSPRTNWDVVHFDGDEASLGMLPSGPYWRVVPSHMLAVRAFGPECPSQGRSLMMQVAEAITWRFRHGPSRMADLVRAGSGVVKIWLEHRPGQDDTFAFTGREGRGIRLAWNERILEGSLETLLQVETAAGRALAEAASDKDAFLEDWAKAPPGLRVDEGRVPVAGGELPAPESIDSSATSVATRALAIALRSKGVATGTYRGSAATEIENQSILPSLLETLHDAARPFDSVALMGLLLKQHERALSARYMNGLRTRWSSQFVMLGFDPVERKREEETQGIRLTRASALMIEEFVRTPPAGKLEPDRVQLKNLLGIANLCIDAAIRSESNHYGLVPAATEITGTYEIRNIPADGREIVDSSAFQDAHLQYDLASAATLSPEDRKRLDLASGVMRAASGFGFETLAKVLHVIQTWPFDPAIPVPIVRQHSLVEACHEAYDEVTPQEFSAAVDALTLRRGHLQDAAIEHWEQESRPFRVTIRPLVEQEADALWLLRWQAEATSRVLSGYLTEGRFFWPPRMLPDGVVAALEAMRQGRNRQLELAVEEEFRAVLPLVRRNVKKAKVLGLSAWHGEIDVIAADPLRKRIWVADAKDVFATFSPAATRRSIHRFYDRPNYVMKLLRKAEAVASDPLAVAAALGVVSPSGSWTVQPIMVTRRHEPAAFIHDRPIPFCPVGELRRFLMEASTS